MAGKYKGRRAYLNDYQQNADGSYTYTGSLYVYQGQASLPLVKVRLWIFGVLMLAALIACGCMTVPGLNSCAYLLIPYALTVTSAITVCWALANFTAGGCPLKEYIYLSTIPKIPARALLTAITSAMVFGGEIFFVLQNGSNGKTMETILFLILDAVSFLSSVFLRKTVKEMLWTKSTA